MEIKNHATYQLQGLPPYMGIGCVEHNNPGQLDPNRSYKVKEGLVLIVLSWEPIILGTCTYDNLSDKIINLYLEPGIFPGEKDVFVLYSYQGPKQIEVTLCWYDTKLTKYQIVKFSCCDNGAQKMDGEKDEVSGRISDGQGGAHYTGGSRHTHSGVDASLTESATKRGIYASWFGSST
ncbi:hypothetical protein A3F08_00070 [Candidatus Berkelbacteria bacterium RIFCSPHIGHO2_12_FULL_36_9]|uniref:Uncharacterized protein n=1 Tax=Candidatus Berkelbacteria bacterium RIFCSPHIGHO2_12_FULL_36_9 TaxID=1797469 RepID=A0A1F5EEL7_9BACT|nr:MAG: hypothetical protein A3F08_00070 [Candidatus Berkelbacteria bacterium RIFCSPHIGHO2_12_FULL_36_9]